LAVLLTGVILGPRLGGISMLVYLGEGAAGLPVFQSGHSGIWYMFGPTGGYLLGFVTAAFIAGTLYSWLPAPARVRLAVSSFAGLASIYLLGTIWLAFAASIAITQAIGLGVAPFITGDAIKIVLVILLAPAGRRLLMGRHPIN
jgi:biotin transport system substrate-specific component